MGRRRSARALGCALALWAGGCGSLVARTFSNDQHGFRGPLRGVRLDLDVLGATPATGAAVLLYGPFILIDIPLSFVLDLLLLPWDAYHATPGRPPVPTPPPPKPRPRPAPPSAPPPPKPREPLTAESLAPGWVALWRTLHGEERTGQVSASPVAGPEVAVLPATPGGLRLVAVGGRRQVAVEGTPPPSVVAATIDARGDALVGHERHLLDVRRRALDAPAVEPASLVGGARVLAVDRARSGRAIVGLERGTVLLEPARRAEYGQEARAAGQRPLDGPARPVAAAITLGGERAAAATLGGEVVVWDLGLRRWVDPDPDGPAEPRRWVLRGEGRPWATSLAFGSDFDLYVGHADGAVVWWRLPPSDGDGTGPGPRATLLGRDPGPVLAFAIGRDLRASAGGSEVVTVRRSSGETVALRVAGVGAPAAHVVALALSPDERDLYVAALDGVVRRVELASGRELDRFDLSPIEDRPRAVAALADGVVTIVTERGTLLRFAPE